MKMKAFKNTHLATDNIRECAKKILVLEVTYRSNKKDMGSLSYRVLGEV